MTGQEAGQPGEKFRDPFTHGGRGKPGANPWRCARARDAVVQYRHAMQPYLPQLLYRVVPAQRPAGPILTLAEVTTYLDEIARDRLPTKLIGFTGGEPFMNPDIVAMLECRAASRGLDALVLTNAMKPLRKLRPAMLALRERHGDRLTIRVSLDHHDPAIHEPGPRP